MEKLIKERLQLLHSAAPDCLGDLLRLELIGCDSEKGEYILRAKTESWMRNVAAECAPPLWIRLWAPSPTA